MEEAYLGAQPSTPLSFVEAVARNFALATDKLPVLAGLRRTTRVVLTTLEAFMNLALTKTNERALDLGTWPFGNEEFGELVWTHVRLACCSESYKSQWESRVVSLGVGATQERYGEFLRCFTYFDKSAGDTDEDGSEGRWRSFLENLDLSVQEKEVARCLSVLFPKMAGLVCCVDDEHNRTKRDVALVGMREKVTKKKKVGATAYVGGESSFGLTYGLLYDRPGDNGDVAAARFLDMCRPDCTTVFDQGFNTQRMTALDSLDQATSDRNKTLAAVIKDKVRNDVGVIFVDCKTDKEVELARATPGVIPCFAGAGAGAVLAKRDATRTVAIRQSWGGTDGSSGCRLSFRGTDADRLAGDAVKLIYERAADPPPVTTIRLFGNHRGRTPLAEEVRARVLEHSSPFTTAQRSPEWHGGRQALALTGSTASRVRSRLVAHLRHANHVLVQPGSKLLVVFYASDGEIAAELAEAASQQVAEEAEARAQAEEDAAERLGATIAPAPAPAPNTAPLPVPAPTAVPVAPAAPSHLAALIAAAQAAAQSTTDNPGATALVQASQALLAALGASQAGGGGDGGGGGGGGGGGVGGSSAIATGAAVPTVSAGTGGGGAASGALASAGGGTAAGDAPAGNAAVAGAGAGASVPSPLSAVETSKFILRSIVENGAKSHARTPQMAAGQKAERRTAGHVAQFAEDRAVFEMGLMQSRRARWVMVSPDGLAIMIVGGVRKLVCLEFKVTTQHREVFTPDHVESVVCGSPRYYELVETSWRFQLALECLVTGARDALLVVCSPTNPLQRVLVHYPPGFIDAVTEFVCHDVVRSALGPFHDAVGRGEATGENVMLALPQLDGMAKLVLESRLAFFLALHRLRKTLAQDEPLPPARLFRFVGQYWYSSVKYVTDQVSQFLATAYGPMSSHLNVAAEFTTRALFTILHQGLKAAAVVGEFEKWQRSNPRPPFSAEVIRRNAAKRGSLVDSLQEVACEVLRYQKNTELRFGALSSQARSQARGQPTGPPQTPARADVLAAFPDDAVATQGLGANAQPVLMCGLPLAQGAITMSRQHAALQEGYAAIAPALVVTLTKWLQSGSKGKHLSTIRTFWAGADGTMLRQATFLAHSLVRKDDVRGMCLVCGRAGSAKDRCTLCGVRLCSTACYNAFHVQPVPWSSPAAASSATQGGSGEMPADAVQVDAGEAGHGGGGAGGGGGGGSEGGGGGGPPPPRLGGRRRRWRAGRWLRLHWQRQRQRCQGRYGRRGRATRGARCGGWRRRGRSRRPDRRWSTGGGLRAAGGQGDREAAA